MVNKVILIGRLGADPEIKRTQDGRPVANLRLATSDTWRDKNTGERKQKTEWHRIVIFNEGLCGVVEQYAKKGHQIYIEGTLRTRKWTDQAGVEKYSTEVVLENFNGKVMLLESAGNRPAPSENDYGTTTNRDAGGSSSVRSQNEMDDEIPF